MRADGQHVIKLVIEYSVDDEDVYAWFVDAEDMGV